MAAEQQGVAIAAALREGRRVLAAAGIETPGLDAEVLLRHALRLDRTTLFTRLPEPIDPAALRAYETLLTKRARGTPVAYLTGEREFMGLPLTVGPEVLVPRPETEILVEWALRWLRELPPAVVVDVGAGSGAIALSIAAGMGSTWRGRVIGSDISPAALAVAARNRDRLGLAERVVLMQSSLLTWLDEPVDLVLANLPYLRPEQIAEQRELASEPRLALDGGADGLGLLRRLLADAPRVVAPGGAVGLEIDPSQRSAVTQMAREAFPGARISVLRDLAGLDRHVVVEAGPHPLPPLPLR